MGPDQLADLDLHGFLIKVASEFSRERDNEKCTSPSRSRCGAVDEPLTLFCLILFFTIFQLFWESATPLS